MPTPISVAFRTWFLKPLVAKMSDLSDEVQSVRNEVTKLKTALADGVTRVLAFQQTQSDLVKSQSDKIDALTAELANGGAPQSVIDQLEAIKADAVEMQATAASLDATPTTTPDSPDPTATNS